jgi:ligand-binding sensor domain-containing protein
MTTATFSLGWLLAGSLLLGTSLASGAENAEPRASWPEERSRSELKQRSRIMGERFQRANDADYARSLMAAAARERQNNGRLLPGAQKVDDITLGEVWSNLGPARMHSGPMDSGRVSAIVTHPDNSNILYVASAGGGVWRSLDAGTTWKAMTDSLGSLGSGALAIDASLPNRLYLGLGDTLRTGYLSGPSTSLGTAPGLGVLKSTDGGVTWSAPVLLGDSSSIRKIIVSPNNSNLILVATDQGLYRSTNAGASYQLQPLGAGDGKPEVWSIAWSGGNRFTASTRSSSGKIWFSTEQAASWTEAAGYANNLGRISLASAPSSPNIQYALTHDSNDIATQIYKSTDGGQDWSSLNIDQESYVNHAEPVRKLLGGQGYYNQMVVVNPTTPNIAYFGGQLRLARTGDGGATFSVVNSLDTADANYVHADFHAAAYDNANRLYVGNDGGVFRSSNAGQTWSDHNDGLITHLVYGVAASVADLSEVLVALQDNGIFHSSNTGTDYSRMAGGDGFWALLSQNNAGKLIIATNGGTYQSDDGGLTGGVLEFDGIPNGAASFIDQSPAVASGETLYAVSQGKIYRSTNFGKLWSAVAATGLPGNVRWVRSGRNSGVLVALVGHLPGQVWFTLNNGAQWTQAVTPANADGTFLDAAIGDDNQFYVISDGYRDGKSRIWTSNNPASGWVAGAWGGLPAGVRLNALKADPVRNGTIYVATDLGMYRSINKGLGFSRLGAGLPLVSVADIWVARDGSRLRVGTYGRGVWNLVLQN